MAHRGVAQEKALRLMLRPAADHRFHQDYISDHLELTGERKEEEEEEDNDTQEVFVVVVVAFVVVVVVVFFFARN